MKLNIDQREFCAVCMRPYTLDTPEGAERGDHEEILVIPIQSVTRSHIVCLVCCAKQQTLRILPKNADLENQLNSIQYPICLKKNALDAKHPILSSAVCDLLNVMHDQSLPLPKAERRHDDTSIVSLYPKNVGLAGKPNGLDFEKIQGYKVGECVKIEPSSLYELTVNTFCQHDDVGIDNMQDSKVAGRAELEHDIIYFREEPAVKRLCKRDDIGNDNVQEAKVAGCVEHKPDLAYFHEESTLPSFNNNINGKSSVSTNGMTNCRKKVDEGPPVRPPTHLPGASPEDGPHFNYAYQNNDPQESSTSPDQVLIQVSPVEDQQELTLELSIAHAEPLVSFYEKNRCLLDNNKSLLDWCLLQQGVTSNAAYSTIMVIAGVRYEDLATQQTHRQQMDHSFHRSSPFQCEKLAEPSDRVDNENADCSDFPGNQQKLLQPKSKDAHSDGLAACIDYTDVPNEHQKLPPIIDQNNSVRKGKHNNGGVISPFPQRLHEILTQNRFPETICWAPNGRWLSIRNPLDFEKRIIPLYFSHTTMGSFYRQLTIYGFKRIYNGAKGLWYHDYFLRGQPNLYSRIERKQQPKKKKSNATCNPESEPKSFAGRSVEVAVVTSDSTIPETPNSTGNVIILNENDVLFGRGGNTNKNSGNVRLRTLAKFQKEAYSIASREEKTRITQSIVQCFSILDPPGRFLKSNAFTGKWEEVEHRLAHEKASQALRQAIRDVH